eukprot:Opistho-2@70646
MSLWVPLILRARFAVCASGFLVGADVGRLHVRVTCSVQWDGQSAGAAVRRWSGLMWLADFKLGCFTFKPIYIQPPPIDNWGSGGWMQHPTVAILCSIDVIWLILTRLVALDISPMKSHGYK